MDIYQMDGGSQVVQVAAGAAVSVWLAAHRADIINSREILLFISSIIANRWLDKTRLD